MHTNMHKRTYTQCFGLLVQYLSVCISVCLSLPPSVALSFFLPICPSLPSISLKCDCYRPTFYGTLPDEIRARSVGRTQQLSLCVLSIDVLEEPPVGDNHQHPDQFHQHPVHQQPVHQQPVYYYQHPIDYHQHQARQYGQVAQRTTCKSILPKK